jgi:hypothetical protein
MTGLPLGDPVPLRGLLPKVDANAMAPGAEQDGITVALRTLPQTDGLDPHCALGPHPAAYA